MGNWLEGLVDARLGQPVMDGSGPAERISRIPDNVPDAALAVSLKEFIDDCLSPVCPRRYEREGSHHAGNLRPERGPLDPIGPPDIACLHRQMQLEAHVRARRSAVGGRAVSRPGIAVDGVLLASVGTDAKHPRLPDRPTLLRCLLHELGLGGLPVEDQEGPLTPAGRSASSVTQRAESLEG
jgi:hypothetical protein